jgi:hypothetical protein
MRKCLFALILVMASVSLSAQNLIGLSEPEIRKYMSENEKGLSLQSFVNNSTFKYLKYTDSDEIITVLIFLNEQMTCKSIRQICDKRIRTKKVEELNAKYKKTGDNQWTETKDNKTYLIVLKDEDYSFNVTITLKE